MRVLMIVAMALAMFGCASAPERLKANKPENQAKLDQDVAKCEYEGEVAVRRAEGNYRTSVGAELDKIYQKKDLFKLCMRAKGWEI